MKHNAWHTGDNKWSLFIAANVPPPMKQSTRLARPGPVHFCVTVASNTHLARSSPVAGPDMSCSSPSLRSHLSCFLLTEMPVSTGYNLSHPSSPAETFHLHNTPLNRPLAPLLLYKLITPETNLSGHIECTCFAKCSSSILNTFSPSLNNSTFQQLCYSRQHILITY